MYDKHVSLCHLYVCVFDWLQGLEAGGRAQTLQPLRDVEDVESSGAQEDGPEENEIKKGIRHSIGEQSAFVSIPVETASKVVQD